MPEVQDKIYKEIKEKIGDRFPQVSDKEELHYFMAVLQEGYRHVLAGSFNVPHFSSRAFTLGGHRIPRGTQVYVNYGAIRRDSRYFKVLQSTNTVVCGLISDTIGDWQKVSL